MRENLGALSDCSQHAKECGYRCCDQDVLISFETCRENMILLYPGELETTRLPKAHLITTDVQTGGGRFAACDRVNFDQSSCNSVCNFKPLDCQSYPFSPILVNGQLRLMLDAGRCPLSRELISLKAHYNKIHTHWEQLIANDFRIYCWVAGMSCLPGDYIIESI